MHHVVAIHTSGCDECCVCRIGGMHWDLVVARVCVKEGLELMASCCIHYLVTTREGKRHHVVAIHTSGCDECCFCRIGGMHRDLVVARVRVKEG